MTRVLILGASGMLGHKLCQVLGAAPGLEVHATTRHAAPDIDSTRVELHTGVDLAVGTAPLARVLDLLGPDVIVNAIGAIKQKDLRAAIDATFFVNSTLPHILPLLNPNANGRVIHLSTDCVFTGTTGGYQETDRPDATDVYGRSKAVGEIDYGRHVTLRTSIIGFERRGHLGLLSWFFSQPRGSRLRGFTQAMYSGVPTVTIARTIQTVIANHDQVRGLYHVASEPISKHALLCRMNDAFDLGHHLDPDPSLRIDRSLDDARFRAATKTIPPSWDLLMGELRQDYDEYGYDVIYRARRERRPAS